ncbi:MAG: N-carbamoyl-D-amino-acid hydrolase [Pirellulaceae bacterium]|nr:N-carbamoyl-D-amino-acid hydrolase [Pirellulaceae bacterium]MDP7015931.1 N-carbamoyl-D-amino-acid hydrolase [Pirellulaceae bacterium]
MTRIVKIAAAQSGPIPLGVSRETVVRRLIEKLQAAAADGCDLIVFSECALTPFFPHWWIENEEELDQYYELRMPNPVVQPLFDAAAARQIAFYLGYAELDVAGDRPRRFNTSILVDKAGAIVGKHRKIHLPGHADHRPDNPFQNLEKRYFESGDLGFQTWSTLGGKVGMCICNDRRWPETYRVLALQGAELILLGYNTPDNIPEHPEMDRLVNFHHQLCMQAGAYQNGCWIVAVAKAGVEEGVSQIGLTTIIAPSGEIKAQSQSLGDELVVFPCDLDESIAYRELFDFQANRRPHHYGLIAES